MAETHGLDEPMPDTPDAAALEIDAIFADREHPYHLKPGQPLRDRAMERVTKLFEVRSRAPKELDGDAAVRELKERQATAQTKIENDYVAAVGELKALGVPQPDGFSPGKTRAYQVASAQQEAFLHKGEYGKLASSLRDSFRTIQPNSEMQLELTQFEKMITDDLGTAGLNAIGSSLIEAVIEKNFAKYEVQNYEKSP